MKFVVSVTLYDWSTTGTTLSDATDCCNGRFHGSVIAAMSDGICEYSSKIDFFGAMSPCGDNSESRSCDVLTCF